VATKPRANAPDALIQTLPPKPEHTLAHHPKTQNVVVHHYHEKEIRMETSVYVVSILTFEGSWVAGAYSTESRARQEAQQLSLKLLKDSLTFAPGNATFDRTSRYFLAESAGVFRVLLDVDGIHKYPGREDTVATYRYGLDTSTTEFDEKYDTNGYPREGVEDPAFDQEG
jgi:hypothetical protein